MNGLEPWELALLGVVAYLAVTSLVRLMAAHRHKVTEELRAQFRAEQQKKKPAKPAKGSQDKAA